MENSDGKEEIGVVEVTGGKDEGEFFDVEQILVKQLSLNALLGIAHPTNTFTSQVQLGKRVATALVDTGNDASFITSKLAVKAKQVISTV
jgi:hypothetical protein